MKILMLAHEAPEDFKLRDDTEKFDAYMGEWYAFSEGLKQNNTCLDSAALEPPATATVVSIRDGVRKVEDGPYPDVKEQLGGFFVIEAPDLEAATELASKCPAAKNGFVEVRPIMNIEGAEQ